MPATTDNIGKKILIQMLCTSFSLECYTKCQMLWYNEKKVIITKLEEAKILYQGEWIAFRTFEESDNPEGEVVLHNKDRRTFDKELLQKELTDVYITFAGPPVPEGYAVIF